MYPASKKRHWRSWKQCWKKIRQSEGHTDTAGGHRKLPVFASPRHLFDGDKTKKSECPLRTLRMVWVVIQNFLKTPVISRTCGYPDRKLGPEESPEERIKIPLDFIQNFTVGFKGDNKITLYYCCSQLSEHILRKETEFSLKFKEEFISEMEQFGSYHALFNKVEFLHNMLD